MQRAQCKIDGQLFDVWAASTFRIGRQAVLQSASTGGFYMAIRNHSYRSLIPVPIETARRYFRAFRETQAPQYRCPDCGGLTPHPPNADAGEGGCGDCSHAFDLAVARLGESVQRDWLGEALNSGDGVYRP